MIPSTLKMRNFMCYRDAAPELNFDGIHIACLCGANGSGKSTVFDAITWALWGKTSRGRNEDIVSTGQDEMEVEFEFYEGTGHYRIIRKYTRSTGTKSGQVMLDLQVADDGRYHSIAEHTIKDTQEKIIRLLHLDYQTFTNSALLLQGKANEFSIKIPSERKDILARILDLSFYDDLEEDAKAEAEKNKNEYLRIESYISAIDQRIRQRPNLEEALKTVLGDQEAIGKSRRTIDNELQGLRKRREMLEARDEHLKLLQGQLESRNNDIQRIQEKLAAALKNLDHFNKVIADREDIERGYATYKQLTTIDEEYNKKLSEFLALTKQKNRLESTISSIRNEIDSERKLLSVSINELEKRLAQLPSLQNKKEEINRQQSELEKIEASIIDGQNMIKETTASISSISTRNSQVLDSIQDVRNKIAMISQTEAVCPLCERELGPDEHRRIRQKLEQELQEYMFASQENIQKISHHKAMLGKLEREAREKEGAYKSERDKIRQEAALVNKAIDEIKKAEAELAEKKPRLEQFNLCLTNRTYAETEFNELSVVEQKLKELNYEQSKHDGIRREKSAVAKYEELNKGLNEALLRIESEEKTALDSHASLERLQSEISDLNRQQGSLTHELSELPGIIDKLEIVERQYNSILALDTAKHEEAAQLRENIRQIDILVEERKKKTAELDKFKKSESIYTELARHFSKRGIQAVIIAESLPEISNEANDLLGRMTDNRMSVTLESQKETRKGETVETLDIKVADELGTRSYEMYSGGEAFRIDLALRIAISRLLVRRAGASLPILIIDEGFGTQDSSGLEKLIEAINYIQDDFEKIFIITHLEDLRDKFPVIINVTKTAEGSTISLSQ